MNSRNVDAADMLRNNDIDMCEERTKYDDQNVQNGHDSMMCIANQTDRTKRTGQDGQDRTGQDRTKRCMTRWDRQNGQETVGQRRDRLVCIHTHTYWVGLNRRGGRRDGKGRGGRGGEGESPALEEIFALDSRGKSLPVSGVGGALPGEG
jgi:hypothetical protein